jgi:hypothetical protein
MQIDRPGGFTPLWWLRELSNIDKHRQPVVAGSAIRWFGSALPRGLDVEDVDWKSTSLLMTVGSELVRAVLSEPRPDVDLMPDFHVDISFGDAGFRGLKVIETLWQIHFTVGELVPERLGLITWPWASEGPTP